MTSRDTEYLLEKLDLKEYEAIALQALLELGRTTAPNLVDATEIPQARIYTVLDSLADRGFVKIFPKRPKEYQPKPPTEILARAKENRRHEYETYCREVDDLADEFLETFEPLYEQASEDVRPAEELFHVIDVGEPSETETKNLYRDSTRQVLVATKSFEYFPEIQPAFDDAVDRDISVRVLLLHPRHLGEHNREIQREIVAQLATYDGVTFRFSNERLPLRGTIVDPSLDYETGKSIFLVEQPDVPLQMRQAALTENPSLVAGMKRYVDLIWEYDSVGEYPS